MASFNHPPAVSQNAISHVTGQVNDFAGTVDEVRGMDQPDASSESTLASDRRGPVPVVVTSIQAPHAETLPGLREAMIASAIIRLVTQLPEGNAIGAEIRKSALKLFTAGGEKIVAYGKEPAPTTAAARPKKSRR